MRPPGPTHDRFMPFDGRVPLWADYGEEERVVGGVGVSGGTVARDVACAEAGASAHSAGRASLSAPRTAGIRHD
ncbi:heme-binding protein [Nonomuraea indica]|uniref:heme-binding protein n=1 Tax=Nonomuraea indica TaxID=1581193 RepID=UPI0031845598